MNYKTEKSFAECIRAMTMDIIESRASSDQKMLQLGRLFALYGYHAQRAGYIEALEERIRQLEEEAAE